MIAPRVTKHIDAVVEEAISWKGEFRMEDDQGRTHWIKTRTVPILGEGEVTRVLATANDITDKKERERDLRLKERAMDEANVGIQITDPNQEGNPLVYVNDGFEAQTGYRPDDVLGQNPRFLQGPETDPAAVDKLRAAVEDQEPVTVELKNYRADGSSYWSRLSLTPVYDEDGTLRNYVGIQQDVTDRRRQTEQLARQQQKLDLLLAGTETGIAEWTLQTDEVQWDETLQELVGANPQTFDAFAALVHPDDRARVETALDDVVDTDTSWNGEFRFEAGADEIVWVETRVTPVYRAGETVSVMATGTDITERKQREQRLRMLSEAVEQASESVLITEGTPIEEPGPRITYVNEAYENMSGYAAEEVIGRTPRILQGPETDRAVLDTLREALEAEEAWQGETINYRKDETPYRVQWNVAPVFGDDSDVEHWVSVQRDVTEQREREQTIKNQKELLDQILASIEDIVFLCDENGDLLLWNDHVNTVTGYTDDEIDGMKVSDFFTDENATRARAALEEGFTTGRVRQEIPLLTADGEIVPHEWGGTVFEDPNRGRVLCGVGRDLTERKAQQHTIRRVNQRFEQFAETVPNAFFIVTPDYSELLYSNSATETLYGVDESTLHEDPSAWTRHVHPADLHRVQSAMQNQAEGKADWPKRQEFRVQHPTRGRRWLMVRLDAIYDDEGTVQQIAGVATDVTERKVREQRLRALHEVTRELIDVDTQAGAASIVTTVLSDTLGLEEAAVYLRQDDALQRAAIASDEAVDRPGPRIEKGHTALWTALDEDTSQVYASPSTIDDSVDWSHLASCAHVPIDQYGVLSVGTSDPTRLNEDELRLAEVAAQSLGKALGLLDWKHTLRESERRYRTLAENIPDGAVLLFDDELRYTLAVGKLLEEDGLDESDIIGKQAGTVLDLGPATTDKHPLLDRYRAALEGERTRRRLKIDDRILQVHIVPLPTQDASQGLLLVWDITEQRRMQERLLEVQEEERRRIDQEIHDEMGGLLTSLQLSVDLARYQMPEQDSSNEHLDQLEALVSELSTVARTVSRKLYPSGLSDHGLERTLPSLVDDLDAQHGLTVDLRCDLEPDARYSSLVERTAYWIVQEALVNVARHADTDRADVVISVQDHRLSIRVEDEGVGFDPSAETDDKSFGLEGIRRRVERLKGEIAIDAAPDEGTVITVALPLAVASEIR